MRTIMMAVPTGILGERLQVPPVTAKFALNAEIVNGSEGVIHYAWNKSREAISKR
jgi:hypothetical protein